MAELWQEIQLKLKEGDAAPDFSAATNGGGKVSLADFKGKNVILYFYPRDDTPGCTKEACALPRPFCRIQKARRGRARRQHRSGKVARQVRGEIQAAVHVLADEDKKIVDAYGVWGEKSFMGRKYLGTHRVTFLIGPDGRIKKIWPQVKPDEHAAEVLAAL